jgi:hypothetical protein
MGSAGPAPTGCQYCYESEVEQLWMAKFCTKYLLRFMFIYIQLAELESGEAHLHEWLSRLGQAAPKPKPPQPLKFVYLNWIDLN